VRALLALSLVNFAAQAASAATLFGPTPYRSAADGPFDRSGLGSTFFLEDFEDGELNTPGITQYILPAVVNPPGTLTDSVDGDDGVLDGSGQGGHSFRSRAYSYEFTAPMRYYLTVAFDIDTDALGFTPNTFGFVWTDGPPTGFVALYLLTDDRQIISMHGWDPSFNNPLGDEQYDGGASEDTFYGIYEPAGITRVAIETGTKDDSIDWFEFDHLQYGLIVPEPSALACAATAILACLFTCQPRRGLERLTGISLTVNTHLFS
jgi:hypothetical protein